MNVLRAKWLSTMKTAKKQYDKGASIFTCDCILNDAKRFFKLMEETEAKEKKAEKKAAEEAEKRKIAKSKFEEVGARIGLLVSEKNAAYGDSFEKSENILKLLYPNGIKIEDYKNVLAIVRIQINFFG